jgi:hypothetical protein
MGVIEELVWDHLAMLYRNGETYAIEPHISGGVSVSASRDPQTASQTAPQILNHQTSTRSKRLQMSLKRTLLTHPAFIRGLYAALLLSFAAVMHDAGAAVPSNTVVSNLGNPITGSVSARTISFSGFGGGVPSLATRF